MSSVLGWTDVSDLEVINARSPVMLSANSESYPYKIANSMAAKAIACS